MRTGRPGPREDRDVQATIRRATPADADALVVLRAAMFTAIGDDVGDEHAAWRGSARTWFAEHLDDGTALCVVADVPRSGPVSSALAVLMPRAPSPTNGDPRVAHVSQVSTLPGHRRQGHARACLGHLLAELDRAGVGRADLHATGDGEALYRSLGFIDAPFPSLRRRRP